MATTATKNAGALVTRAFKTAGIVAKDEPLDADQMNDGLELLNDMLKAWQMTGLRLYTRTTGSLTLTNATASYAISGRPLDLDVVRYRPSAGNELPMFRMTSQEYDELPNKASVGSPTQYFYDRARETGTLYVWPVKATITTETIEWSGLREVEDITASTDVVDAPASWYEAIRYGLCARVCDDYDVDLNKSMKIAQQAQHLYDVAMAYERPESVTFSADWR
jgi:hypothetical protein